jgi:hypothetical protein
MWHRSAIQRERYDGCPVLSAIVHTDVVGLSRLRLIGRAFLVNQDFDGMALFPDLGREMGKVNAELIAAVGVGGVFLPRTAARSRIASSPFRGIRVRGSVAPC